MQPRSYSRACDRGGRVVYRKVIKSKSDTVRCPFCKVVCGERCGKSYGCNHYDGYGYAFGARRYDHYFL